MYSFMRTKVGVSQCPKCSGKGCFSCDRTGEVISCPRCGNVNMATKAGNTYTCQACDTPFNQAGETVSEDEA